MPPPQPPSWLPLLFLFKCITFGKSNAPSGPPHISITLKLALHMLQTQCHQTHPVPCPNLSYTQATDELVDHPRTLLEGLAVAVPLGRMTQRRHYANLCLSRSLPPYCCCCHKDQLRNVYINSNTHWGWGAKPNNTGCGKVAGVLKRRINSAVYSLVSTATTCAALLGNAWIWFDLLCWVCQSVGHFWKRSVWSVTILFCLWPLFLFLFSLPLTHTHRYSHTVIFKDSSCLLGETHSTLYTKESAS